MGTALVVILFCLFLVQVVVVKEKLDELQRQRDLDFEVFIEGNAEEDDLHLEAARAVDDLNLELKNHEERTSHALIAAARASDYAIDSMKREVGKSLFAIYDMEQDVLERLGRLESGIDDLAECALKSLVCQARNGHAFECVLVVIDDAGEADYQFCCTKCGLSYWQKDGNLNKKEERWAQKYIDSFKPSKTK